MNKPKVKRVGYRDTLAPDTPEAHYRRAQALQRQSDKLNPYPRPRGFVFKAKTREDYEKWRQNQDNPRRW